MLRRSTALSALALTLLAGCASTPKEVAIAPPPPAPPPPVTVAMPRGAYPGMAIPALLADGHYATPNRNLSAAGSVWHLRAALNVAALACRGTDEAAIIAGYNALLAREKAPLALAQTSYAAEYKVGGGDWQDRYDDQMTRLYNFFSQSPARDGFCAAAATTLADSTTVDAAAFPAFAATRLAVLEQPFTDFYAAFDSWRRQRAAASQMASVGPMPAAMMTAAPASRPMVVQPVPAAQPYLRPQLDLDTKVVADTAVAH
ncbi:hypothetical protein [Sphingomonas sp. GC_Shp_1]|uniref:hypothetical protein n=1 Tax=unclassified Sphingomonas TaxID=196159 RepID=UPI00226AAA68